MPMRATLKVTCGWLIWLVFYCGMAFGAPTVTWDQPQFNPANSRVTFDRKQNDEATNPLVIGKASDLSGPQIDLLTNLGAVNSQRSISDTLKQAADAAVPILKVVKGILGGAPWFDTVTSVLDAGVAVPNALSKANTSATLAGTNIIDKVRASEDFNHFRLELTGLMFAQNGQDQQTEDTIGALASFNLMPLDFHWTAFFGGQTIIGNGNEFSLVFPGGYALQDKVRFRGVADLFLTENPTSIGNIKISPLDLSAADVANPQGVIRDGFSAISLDSISFRVDSVVPEPTSLSLMVIPLLVFSLLRQGRR